MPIPEAFAEELRTMIASAVGEVLQEQAPPEDEEEVPPEEEIEEQEELPPEEEELPAEGGAAAAAQAIMAAVEDAVAEIGAEEMPPEEEEFEALLSGYPLDPRQAQVEFIDERVAQLEAQLAQAEASNTLDAALEEANLPEPLAAVVESQYRGRVFDPREVDSMIGRLREAARNMDPSGRVTGAGGRNGRQISVGISGREQAEIEFLRLVAGDWQFRRLESLAQDDEYVRRRLESDAWRAWIRSGRPAQYPRRLSNWVYELLGGDPFIDDRAAEAVSTSSMTSIVKNTVNILLAANYAQRHQWWGPITRQEEVDTIDDATLVRVYGLNTLSVVDEGAAYTELPWADEEETAVFVKKGNYIAVTMETLLRDKLNMIRTIPERLSTSWYNTISSLVSNVFTLNSAAGPVLGDTGALFNATAATSAGGHANLLTTAFDYSAFDAVVTAMKKQTDQVLGAGQRLLISPRYVLGPPDIRATVLQVRNSELIPGSANNDVNVYQNAFDFIEVPTWTDTNNWATVADPAQFPALYLIFLRGRAVPELFTADAETSGTMFTNDTLRYKVRMLTYRFSSTYDCAPVADFRPLHKSNVA